MSAANSTKPPETLGKRLLRSALVGAVEIGARGVTRFLESVTDDVGKVVEQNRKKIVDWRRDNLGEIDMPVDGDASKKEEGTKT